MKEFTCSPSFLVELEELMQQPVDFTIALGGWNETVLYPLWEFVSWAGLALL